jgi:hypothetical protein
MIASLLINAHFIFSTTQISFSRKSTPLALIYVKILSLCHRLHVEVQPSNGSLGHHTRRTPSPFTTPSPASNRVMLSFPLMFKTRLFIYALIIARELPLPQLTHAYHARTPACMFRQCRIMLVNYSQGPTARPWAMRNLSRNSNALKRV